MNDVAPRAQLAFRGGLAGALLPLAVFLAGVIWLGLSGAPDERGFWPILLGAWLVGLLLARDRSRYCETLIDGMSRPIVMVMILAWLLAGVLASLMSASGFVDALVRVAVIVPAPADQVGDLAPRLSLRVLRRQAREQFRRDRDFVLEDLELERVAHRQHVVLVLVGLELHQRAVFLG